MNSEFRHHVCLFCENLITHVWFMMWRELFNWIFQLQFSNYRELAPFHPKGPHHLAKKETNTKCCHLAIKRRGLHGSDGTISSNQHGSDRRGVNCECCHSPRICRSIVLLSFNYLWLIFLALNNLRCYLVQSFSN